MSPYITFSSCSSACDRPSVVAQKTLHYCGGGSLYTINHILTNEQSANSTSSSGFHFFGEIQKLFFHLIVRVANLVFYLNC